MTDNTQRIEDIIEMFFAYLLNVKKLIIDAIKESRQGSR
jgi:hypothetical protein